jgi:hypothetical protein
MPLKGWAFKFSFNENEKAVKCDSVRFKKISPAAPTLFAKEGY